MQQAAAVEFIRFCAHVKTMSNAKDYSVYIF